LNLKFQEKGRFSHEEQLDQEIHAQVEMSVSERILYNQFLIE